MRAGDATFHNGFLIHGAEENKTDTIREAMIVTFFEDDLIIQSNKII